MGTSFRMHLKVSIYHYRIDRKDKDTLVGSVLTEFRAFGPTCDPLVFTLANSSGNRLLSRPENKSRALGDLSVIMS